MNTTDKRPELCGFSTPLDLEELLRTLQSTDTGFMWVRREKDAYDYLVGSLNGNGEDSVEIRYKDRESSPYELLLHVRSHYAMIDFHDDKKVVCYGPDGSPHPPCDGILQAREKLMETMYTALEKAAITYLPIFSPPISVRISPIEDEEESSWSIEELEDHLDVLKGLKEGFERDISKWERMEGYVQRARRQELIASHKQMKDAITPMIADTEKRIASKKT